MKTRYLVSFLVLFVPFVVTSGLSGAENVDHAATLSAFLNDDTTIVAYLDAAALPSPGNPAELFKLLPLVPEETQSKLLGLMMASGLVSKFQAAGGQGIYVV